MDERAPVTSYREMLERVMKGVERDVLSVTDYMLRSVRVSQEVIDAERARRYAK